MGRIASQLKRALSGGRVAKYSPVHDTDELLIEKADTEDVEEAIDELDDMSPLLSERERRSQYYLKAGRGRKLKLTSPSCALDCVGHRRLKRGR